MISSTTILEELERHGYCASTTRGRSMEPLFRTGRDMVVIKKASGECKKYDVVLYRYPSGKYVLHRIIRVRENEYIIRGDNTYVKEHIPKEKILGVLERFNRKGKSHTVEEKSFKIYSRLWNFIYPVRFVFYLFYRCAAKAYRLLFKKKR
ncbi:MAG: S24/S26 family peptidase [Clostridia bacterium]|nr:S24/S26 family peptidase [Clostridia bacterium]